MGFWGRWAAAVAALAAAPVVIGRPRGVAPGPYADIDAVVAACRTTGLTGGELVADALARVGQQFETYSCRLPWRSPAAALAARSGYSTQYNGALAEVLRALGCEVEQVFAARVRVDDSPWFKTGHTWLRVTIDGRPRNVCVAHSARPGETACAPLTEVRRFTALTRVDTTAALCSVSAYEQWRSIATGRRLPGWFERPFHGA